MVKPSSASRPRLAIVRTSGRPVQYDSYNVQEIGLAQSLTECGWHCDVYMASPNKQYQIIELKSQLQVIYLPYKVFLGDQGFFPGLLQFLRLGNYDVIQIQEHWQFTSILISKVFGKSNTPIVLGQGKYNNNKGLRRLQNLVTDVFAVPILRHNISCAICKTLDAETYLNNKGIYQTVVIPVGLDISRFPAEENVNNLTFDKFRLLYIGSIQRRRNIPFLIDVVAYLIQKNLPVDLTIVGVGPELEACRSRVEALGLSDVVTFAGTVPQKDISHFYSQSHCFLLPTSAEIFGMVVLESMYFGVPVIATNTPGPKTLLINEQDGYLMQELNISEWGETIIHLFKNPTLYKKLSAKCAQKVRQQFTWKVLGSEYANIYSSLIT